MWQDPYLHDKLFHTTELHKKIGGEGINSSNS